MIFFSDFRAAIRSPRRRRLLLLFFFLPIVFLHFFYVDGVFLLISFSFFSALFRLVLFLPLPPSVSPFFFHLGFVSVLFFVFFQFSVCSQRSAFVFFFAFSSLQSALRLWVAVEEDGFLGFLVISTHTHTHTHTHKSKEPNGNVAWHGTGSRNRWNTATTCAACVNLFLHGFPFSFLFFPFFWRRSFIHSFICAASRLSFRLLLEPPRRFRFRRSSSFSFLPVSISFVP